jgi:hypothetical protein
MASIRVRNRLNRKHMVVSIVKPISMLQLCRKCFQSGLHTTLECRDTKLWPVSGCITISLPWRAEPTNKSLNKKNVETLVHIWNTGEERHVTSERFLQRKCVWWLCDFCSSTKLRSSISRRNNKPKPQRHSRESRGSGHEGCVLDNASHIQITDYHVRLHGWARKNHSHPAS